MNAPHHQTAADLVPVIAFVREKQLWPVDRHGQKCWNRNIIRDFAARQDKSERAALTVRTGVDFARKAAA